MSNNNKGNTIILYPIILFFSIIIVIFIGYFFINLIFPFIWYEKLNAISQKYMYIIEKYGYLTDLEEYNLISDLKNSGFDIDNIEIEIPSRYTTYGELLNFKIKYKIFYIVPFWGKTSQENMVEIVVNKSSYCKI